MLAVRRKNTFSRINKKVIELREDRDVTDDDDGSEHHEVSASYQE